MAKKQTRNAKGAGHIRRRPDGRWEGRYTVGYSPKTGRQIQKSVYGKTQDEVRRKLNKIIAEIDDGVYIEPTKMTVRQWLDTWLNTYTSDLKKTTINTYRARIKSRIIPYIGDIKLANLTAHDVQRFYNGLSKDGLSPKSLKLVHAIVHKALSQAVDLFLIRANPAEKCKLPRVVKKEIQPLEDMQINAFLQAIKGHRFESLYIVDLFTGMRRGEILGLTWNCVDFKNGTITVKQQLQYINHEFVLITPKNGKPRTITPAPYVMTILKQQKRQQTEWRLIAGELWNNKNNLVFTNQLGNNLMPNTIYQDFKKIAADMGMPSARFHDLRHSYAVAALQSGDNIKVVQENLGHHTAAFTLDVYGHVSERMKQESAARMEKFINRVQAV